MRLKQVRLSGFKSFCDSTEFEFDPDGITIVVGPNGCGKSNVVDAVRWALGEQSPRLMRGTAMGDVIFAGSTTRKPVGRAEVTLIFDNSDRTAIEKYNEYSEIAVTRRLYRSGESEYLINKLPCRLLDIRELVMDTGAAGRSYSIVEQGRVDEFITASPQERRGFMEEAAGIVRYKTRRVAAEKKLEQTRQNLQRVEDVLGELGRQEAVLREQMEAAKEFRSLQREAALLKGDLARLRHDASARICEGLEAQGEQLRNDALAHEQRLLAGNTELEALALRQVQGEEELRRSRGALYGKEREIQETDKELALERQNLDNTNAWSTQLRENLAQLRHQRQTAAEQREAQLAEAQGLEAAVEAGQMELAGLEASHEAGEQARRELVGQLNTAQERLLECHTQLNGIENQQRFLAERLAEGEERRGGLQGRIETVTRELEAVNATRETQTARAAELDAALEAAQADAAALEAELEAGRTAHAESTAQAQQTERAVLECRSRRESLAEIEAGYEGFAEHVRTFLEWTRANPERGEELGVVGPLADLVTVPGEVASVGGDYLAPHLDTVVIRSAAALPHLAEQLQALETGGVRFLALDALPEPHAGNGNGHGYTALSTLLGGEGAAREVLERLFQATRLLPEQSAPYPLPTPVDAGHEWLAADGTFHVDHRARVTLGQADGPGAGLLRRRAELAALAERLEALEAESQQRRERVQALAQQVAELEGRRKEQEQRGAELALARKAAEQELAQARREAERVEQARVAVQRELTQFEAELERHRTQQAELVTERERWQTRKAELETETAGLRKRLEAAQTAQEQSNRRLTEAKVEQSRVVSRLEGLRARLAEGEREQALAAQRMEETEASLAEQEARVLASGENRARLEAHLKELHQALEGLRQAERERRGTFDGLAEQHRVLAERVKADQRTHEANQNRLHELELKLTAERMRLEQHAAVLAELPAREPGEEPAPEEGAEPGAEAPVLDEKALERRLSATTAKLNRMEGINLGAPEEYETLNERLVFLRTQQDDLNAAIADLEATIRRMNAESRKRFKETFDAVNEKFQALFPQVFGGGEARLVLTDSDDPLVAGVDIVAQPPGKKLQSLNLLSGGEKALTAISLIFSFFLHKPSPFCLLDEVDAPLDDVNVSRFKRLIENMTEHSQFIIITHNKRTMEVGRRLYGVTMEEAGVSKVVSVNLAGAA